MVTSLYWKTPVSGAFNLTTNWSPPAPTGGPTATDNVFLGASNTAYTVTSSVNATIDGIGVYTNATLAVTTGTFTVNGFLTNTGVVTVSGGLLAVKVTSAGVLNAGNGLIKATSAGAISLAGAGTVTNDGILEADGTGVLTISGGAKVVGFGDIKAIGAGSSILLADANVSFGGSLSTIAATKTAEGSAIVAQGIDTLSAYGFQNSGVLAVDDGAVVTFSAIVNDSGQIDIGQVISNVAGSATLKIGAAGVTLRGGGKINLTDDAANQIVSTGVAATFTNYDNAISGSGTIGDSLLRVVNLAGGVIDSSGTLGLTLVGDMSSTLGAAYNVGIIESTDAVGALRMEGDWNNAGTIDASIGNVLLQNFVDASGEGTIAATTVGAAIELENATITSGVFSVLAGANVYTTSGSTNALPDDLASAGTINVANSILKLGAIVYNSGVMAVSGSTGELELNSASGYTVFRSGGAVNLSVVGGKAIVSNGSNQQLVNLNETISGYGAIGGAGDSDLFVQNNTDGVIDANNDSNVLSINTGANVVENVGIIESTGAGGLTIAGALYDSGTIYAKTGILKIGGAVTGLGLANILNGAIEFELGSSAMVDFLTGGTGELKLDASATTHDAYTGEIFGFSTTGAGESIDLGDISASGAHMSSLKVMPNGDLVTFTDGTHSSSLLFGGATYTTSSFQLHADAGGHLLVT